MRTNLLAGLLALVAAAAILGCSAKEPKNAAHVEASDHAEHTDHDDHASHDDHAAPEGEHEEGRVVLSDETVATSGITLATAGTHALRVSIDLPGEVAPNADRLAHIVPRFAGIAKQVKKSLGDEVRNGEVLAIVESNESLSPYEVTSLISGTIIEKHITLGEFVRDDSDIYVVADLSTVWVNITVYARDLSKVRRGQSVRLTALGGGVDATGDIDYVGPVLSEATRAATARVVLRNADRAWRPGMFVTARVEIDTTPARIAVEDAALQRLEGRDVVFVREHGAFEARPVTLGRTDGEWTEIVDGLEPGESYVATGSFILKSELLKSEAGHEH